MFRILAAGLVSSLALTLPVPVFAAVNDITVLTDLDFTPFARRGGDDSGSDDDGSRSDDDDDNRGRGRGRGGRDGSDDDDGAGSGSGRDRPRIPGGSGCDDPGDIAEHPECTP
jgi:hypothetical protein